MFSSAMQVKTRTILFVLSLITCSSRGFAFGSMNSRSLLETALRQSIDRGLAKSRFGIVVVSPSFLQKDWPRRELDGLVAREIMA